MMKIELSLKCIEKLLSYANPRFDHYDLYWIEELHEIVKQIDNDTLHLNNLHKVDSHYRDEIRQKDIHRIFLYRWDDWQLKQKKEQEYEQRRMEEQVRQTGEVQQRTSTVSNRVCDNRSNSIGNSRDNKRMQLTQILEGKSFLTKEAIKQILRGSDAELARLYKRYKIE